MSGAKIIEGLKDAVAGNVGAIRTYARALVDDPNSASGKSVRDVEIASLASMSCGPLMCSLGGTPFNNAHIEYWKLRALQAEERLRQMAANLEEPLP